jgi:hypothetical protein
MLQTTGDAGRYSRYLIRADAHHHLSAVLLIARGPHLTGAEHGAQLQVGIEHRAQRWRDVNAARRLRRTAWATAKVTVHTSPWASAAHGGQLAVLMECRHRRITIAMYRQHAMETTKQHNDSIPTDAECHAVDRVIAIGERLRIQCPHLYTAHAKLGGNATACVARLDNVFQPAAALQEVVQHSRHGVFPVRHHCSRRLLMQAVHASDTAQ